jgi:hypothetical protein
MTKEFTGVCQFCGNGFMFCDCAEGIAELEAQERALAKQDAKKVPEGCFFALLLEKVTDSFVSKKDCFRAVIFEVENQPFAMWDKTGKDWDYPKRYVASVADILECDDFQELARATSVHYEGMLTHVYLGNGEYLQPDCLSVFEAAEALMLDRNRVLTEEGFCQEDFAVTG